MQIIDFYKCDDKAHRLSQIKAADWSAAVFLYDILCSKRFYEMFGDMSRLLLLTDGDRLVSFCTLAQHDEIYPTTLTPWVGFVYTFPEYRGKRCAGQLIAYAKTFARQQGHEYLYISTDHTGLYEKYGFEYMTDMKTISGDIARVYAARL